MSPTTLFLVEWAVRLTMFVVIVLRKRAPQVALAWLAVVAFLPFIGTLLYLLMGEIRLGRRRSVRYAAFEDALRESPQLRQQLRQVYQPRLEEPYSSLATLVERVGGSPAYSGNGIELIAGSMDFARRIAADVDAARHHCHLLFYIANDDDAARLVADAMMRAEQRSVECRLLLDAAGSRVFLKSRTADRLRDAGVEVVPLMPVNALRAAVARVDLRNHRKLVVIDGHIGYLGSHNLSTPAYPGKARYGDWIDASVRLRGPVVHQLQTVFLHDWAFNTGRPLPEEVYYPPHDQMEGDMVASLLATGPGSLATPLVDVMTQAVRMAQRRCVLTTPYFVPDEEVLASMRSAALRGVEVVLVVPRRSDHGVTAAAGRSHYGHLLEVGVQIHEYEGGLLHAKTLTTDNELGMIGSANLDVRSFELNFELALLIFDSDFASQLHFLQSGYIAGSRPLTHAAWRARGAHRVLADNVAKLITPLL